MFPLHIHHPGAHRRSSHPHLDLRTLGHEALIAAEVTAAALLLAGSVETAGHADSTAQSSGAGPVAASALTPAASPGVLAATWAGAGSVADVRVPADGDSTISLVRADGAVAATTTVGAGADAIVLFHADAGDYRMVVEHADPVTSAGGAEVSSASVVRTPVVRLDASASVTVRVTAVA